MTAILYGSKSGWTNFLNCKAFWLSSIFLPAFERLKPLSSYQWELFKCPKFSMNIYEFFVVTSLRTGNTLVMYWRSWASSLRLLRISLCYDGLWVDENDSSFTSEYTHINTRVCTLEVSIRYATLWSSYYYIRWHESISGTVFHRSVPSCNRGNEQWAMYDNTETQVQL